MSEDRILRAIEHVHSDVRELKGHVLDPNNGMAVRLTRNESTVARLSEEQATNRVLTTELLTTYRAVKWLGGGTITLVIGAVVKLVVG